MQISRPIQPLGQQAVERSAFDRADVAIAGTASCFGIAICASANFIGEHCEPAAPANRFNGSLLCGDHSSQV
jgi:hypothetical protein